LLLGLLPPLNIARGPFQFGQVRLWSYGLHLSGCSGNGAPTL
jgi:hypothetical protein